MSIKIHHGAPGSYKTSGAVQDDFIPAVLAGRHIITNVRGLSNPDKIREVLEGKGKTVPESFQLTHLDTTEKENMEMLRRFFHWAPSGAFFLLDEIQEIYPKSITESKLDQFDYPGGLDAATENYTFPTLALAFEKHRHKNWDFVVTTPHISKVHKVVRESAEGGYKHRNLATMGRLFAGRYVEGFHMAETNGKASDFYTVQNRRIKKYVFDLYESTATGQVTDTTAGNSIFKDPKILGLVILLIAVIALVLSMDSPEIIAVQDADYRQTKTTDPAPVVDTQTAPASHTGTFQNPQPGGSTHPANVVHVPADPLVSYPGIIQHLLASKAAHVISSYIKGSRVYFKIRFQYENSFTDLSELELKRQGFQIAYHNECMIELTYQQHFKIADCEIPAPPPSETTDSIFTTKAFNAIH